MGSDAIRVTDQIADISGLTSALSAKQATSEKNQANGYPGLDSSGDLVGTFIPRFDTAANLAAIVPANGEHVYETDTKRLKVGDGSTTVALLQPVNALPFTANASVTRFVSEANAESAGVPQSLVNINLASYVMAGSAAVDAEIVVVSVDDANRARRQVRRALAVTTSGAVFTLDGAVSTPIADVGSLSAINVVLAVSITSSTHLSVTATVDDDSEPTRFMADVVLRAVNG